MYQDIILEAILMFALHVFFTYFSHYQHYLSAFTDMFEHYLYSVSTRICLIIFKYAEVMFTKCSIWQSDSTLMSALLPKFPIFQQQ